MAFLSIPEDLIPEGITIDPAILAEAAKLEADKAEAAAELKSAAAELVSARANLSAIQAALKAGDGSISTGKLTGAHGALERRDLLHEGAARRVRALDAQVPCGWGLALSVASALRPLYQVPTFITADAAYVPDVEDHLLVTSPRKYAWINGSAISGTVQLVLNAPGNPMARHAGTEEVLAALAAAGLDDGAGAHSSLGGLKPAKVSRDGNVLTIDLPMGYEFVPDMEAEKRGSARHESGIRRPFEVKRDPYALRNHVLPFRGVQSVDLVRDRVKEGVRYSTLGVRVVATSTIEVLYLPQGGPAKPPTFDPDGNPAGAHWLRERIPLIAGMTDLGRIVSVREVTSPQWAKGLSEIAPRNKEKSARDWRAYTVDVPAEILYVEVEVVSVAHAPAVELDDFAGQDAAEVFDPAVEDARELAAWQASNAARIANENAAAGLSEVGVDPVYRYGHN